MARTDYLIPVMIQIGTGRYRPGWIRNIDLKKQTVRVCYGREREGRISTVTNGRYIMTDAEFRPYVTNPKK